MGVIAPEPGFNEFLARTCADHGALFVSDEVMTGFRASKQGQWGLDGAVEGWRPDLMTFGKVMGGGFPAAAFGGRADVMAHLAPEGPVYQAGTLSGNPIATTAGLATLRLADDAVYDHLTKAGDVIKRPPPRRSRRPACPTSSSRPGPCSPCSSPTGRCATSPAPPPRTPPRSPRSSTRCSTPASTCRPRRTRRGSCPPPTTTARVQTVLDALPGRGPRGRRGDGA